jgi:heptosyltransferase-3
MEPPLSPHRILVIHVTRIGDTVMTSPALRAISEAYPGAQITFLGHPKRAQVIEKLPFVAEVGSITKRSAWLRGRLGGKSWDLGFVFGFDQALLAFALRRCARVAAFEQQSARLNARLWRSAPVAPNNSLHAVARLLQLTEAAGIKTSSRALAYRVTEEESAAARRRLQQHGIAQGTHPLVGLVVESFPTKPYRDWDISHFAELGRRIVQDYPHARIVLLGGAIEPRKIAPLQSALGARLTTLAGSLSLRETAAVMAALDLYVGVDTGPTQIAGALRIPMVGLYHCKHPGSIYAPLDNPNVSVIEHPDRDSPACTEQSSMSQIPVEQVYAAVMARLAAQPPGRSNTT